MTYFGFLLRFLIAPIFLLLIIAGLDAKRGRRRPYSLSTWPIFPAIILHVIVAVVYTTPWDNYLVANSVWWYDPALVAGITLGWVPLEEYAFFVLQPILAGLWLIFLTRRVAARDVQPIPFLRGVSAAAIGIAWLAAALALAFGWRPGTYLALELAWALPPIALQLGFGADILWHNRRLLFWAIVPLTLFLSAADMLAIGSGTWTIDPAQSLGILIGGTLPLEELVFFLLTNILITFGVVLLWAGASHVRIGTFIRRYVAQRNAPQGVDESIDAGWAILRRDNR